MMKIAILTSLVASAAAFAPSKDASRTSVATNMAFEKELGVQQPFYEPLDPLGLLAGADQAKFDRLRYVEIKHGRIAMLAVAGYLTNAAGIYFDGDLATGVPFNSLGYGFSAITSVPIPGLIQIVAFIGFLEVFVMKDIPGTGNEHVGDFRNGFIDFGWDYFDDDVKEYKRNIELNQGRAAQMGILGLMVHEQLGNVEDLFWTPYTP